LRNVLENLGFRTTNVTTGQTRTQEIKDVEHFKTTIYEKLDQSNLKESRQMGKTQRRTDTPIEVQEVLRKSQLGYREVSKSPAPVTTTQVYQTSSSSKQIYPNQVETRTYVESKP
jgi:hypothetical protein